MDYPLLSKMHYSDPLLAEELYQHRFHSEYAHHLDFQIGKVPAFFVATPQIQAAYLAILRTDKQVSKISRSLPPIAIKQFTFKCLVDEIVLTNNIEGVHSTRKEISDILATLEDKRRKDRFRGLVRQYVMLQRPEYLSLETCTDIRKIYDNLVLQEVIADDPTNEPDGTIFRKGSVSVYSPTQKELHQGLNPESAVIAAMESALKYLNDESEELLFRTAVFHYLLGYIHPFYDGNGRLNRFISSYMLTKELEPVLAYRLSYTIKEMQHNYDDAFKICNDPLNRGDLTPFVSMFFTTVEKATVTLLHALESRLTRLTHYRNVIAELPLVRSFDSYYSLLDVLVQAELFSEQGITTRELMTHQKISRGTLRSRLDAVRKSGLLKEHKHQKEKYYGIDLKAVDEYVMQSSARIE